MGVVLIAGCAQQSEVDALKEQNELLKQQVTIKDQQQNQLKKEQDEQALENQKEKDNFDSNLKCQER